MTSFEIPFKQLQIIMAYDPNSWRKEAEFHYCQQILTGIQLSKKFKFCFSDHLLPNCVQTYRIN
jgi:hypothetical protein